MFRRKSYSQKRIKEIGRSEFLIQIAIGTLSFSNLEGSELEEAKKRSRSII